jgi:hypothetical protein
VTFELENKNGFLLWQDRIGEIREIHWHRYAQDRAEEGVALQLETRYSWLYMSSWLRDPGYLRMEVLAG